MRKSCLAAVFLGFFAVADASAFDFNSIAANTWVKDPRPSTITPRNWSGWLGYSFDPVNDRAFIFGLNSDTRGEPLPTLGYGNDAWLFNPATGQWSVAHLHDPNDPNVPSPRHLYGGISYDGKRRMFHLYGGADRGTNYNDLWTYDAATNKFTQIIPFEGCARTKPPYHTDHATIYDEANDVVILQGGNPSSNCGGTADNTWVYSPVTRKWTERPQTFYPSDLQGASMAYDPFSKKVILFGSAGDYAPLSNDLWTYDSAANRWEKKTPPIKPPARGYAGFAYDTTNRIVLLFGGNTAESGTKFNDTWAYDPQPNTWQTMRPQVSPSLSVLVKHGDVMEYDPRRNVFILFTNDGVWYYRYGGAPGSAVAPAAPNGLRVD